jgi:hypothetical protein
MEIDMSAENEVSAESIVEAIIKGDAPNGEYVLDGKTIKGKFDLMHRVISIAIRITNCTFEDEVDLGYCEFKQGVNFLASRFKKEFNSYIAIYQKSIICRQTTFADEVSFGGCLCEGFGTFEGAKFENVNKEINFKRAKFGVDLDCSRAVFKGAANFNGIQCGEVGVFKGAQFENVEEDINFGYAKFGVNLNCTKAVFNGGANFDGIQCKGSGIFRDAKFENIKKDINFSRAKFGVGINCTGEIVFKGGANFNGIQCEGDGFFRNARFENKAKTYDFSYINCSNNLELQEATFAGIANFTHTKILRQLALWKTKFNNGVNFNCVNLHSFSLMDIGDRYGSDSLPFLENDVDLRRLSFTVFDGTKEQQRHVVEKQAPDKFSMDPYLQFEKYSNSIGDDSNAKDIYYEGRKKLHEHAKSKTNPDINWSWGKLKLDFFNRWLVGYGVKLGRTFCWLAVFLLLGVLVFWSDEAMVPKSIGAKTSGFIMAIEPDFKTDFDKKVISDNLRQIFKDNSLILSQQAYIYGDIEKLGKEWNIINYPLYDIQYKVKLEKNRIKIYNTTYFVKRLLHRLGYSLNMLLPIVNLRIADEYKFPSNWDGVCSILRGFYTILHIFAGWILIPLLISSLAGVLRKR